MKIDSYRFGRIVVGGEAHTRDLIVFSDRVTPAWWRRNGHSLSPEDLGAVVDASPSTLILGRGAVGMLRVPEATERYLAERGIRLVALRTAAAVEEYNRHAGDAGTVGAFHLTC